MANTVNQPDGDSVTPSNPPDPAGGGGVDTNPWTVRFEVDWTEEDSYDFAGGDKTIDSVEWTVENFAESDGIDIVNGTGLQVSTDTDTTAYYTAAEINAPRIGVKLNGVGGIYPSLGSKATFALQAIIEPATEPIANYGEWGLGFQDDETNISYFTAVREYSSAAFSGLGGYFWHTINGNRAATAGSAEVAPHTFFEVVYFADVGIAIASSSADADFVEPLTTTTFRAGVDGFGMTGDDVHGILYVANNGSTNKPKCTCTKMRFLTLD